MPARCGYGYDEFKCNNKASYCRCEVTVTAVELRRNEIKKMFFFML